MSIASSIDLTTVAWPQLNEDFILNATEKLLIQPYLLFPEGGTHLAASAHHIRTDWFFNTFDVYKSTNADFDYKTEFPDISDEAGALKCIRHKVEEKSDLKSDFGDSELNELLKEAPLDVFTTLSTLLFFSLLDESFSSKGNTVGLLLEIVVEFSRNNDDANEEDYVSNQFENDIYSLSLAKISKSDKKYFDFKLNCSTQLVKCVCFDIDK